MSKFPVEYSPNSDPSVIDAVNYLLSGPATQTKTYDGASSSWPSYMTGNFRPPETELPIVKLLYAGSGVTDCAVNLDTTQLRVGMLVRGLNVGPGNENVIATIVDDTNITFVNNTTGVVAGSYTFTRPQVGNLQEFYPVLYVPDIALTDGEFVDLYTKKFTFAATQPSIPFREGQSIRISGATLYNGNYRGPGVTECTVDYVIVRSVNAVEDQGTGTGGNTVYTNRTPPPLGTNSPTQDVYHRTDMKAVIIIFGALDQVQIGGQLAASWDWQTFGGAATDLSYTVYLNRYRGYPSSDPNAGEDRYVFETTVAEKRFDYNFAASSTGTQEEEVIFGTFRDSPAPGYYLYAIEVQWRALTVGAANIQILNSLLKLRNISLQVIKGA